MAKARKFSGTSTDYRNKYLGATMEKPKGGRVGRFMARLILIFVSFFVIVGTLLMVFFLPQGIAAYNTQQSQIKELNLPQYRVRHDALGEQVLALWYSEQQTKPPVSLSPSIIWQNGLAVNDPDEPRNNFVVGSISLLDGEMEEARDDSYIERLNYLVQINGEAYVASIAFLVPDLTDDSGLPVLIAEPTLTPAMNSTSPDLAELAEPTGYSEVKNIDNIQARAQEWAEAWTTNNSSAIKGATGDSDNNSYYAGLFPGSWRFVADSLEVDWAYYAASDEQAYVQVTWLIESPRTTGEDEEGNEVTIQGQQMKQTMQLLVGSPDTGLPAITAWGPTGSYLSLEPFQNALTEAEYELVTTENGNGEEIEEEEETTPSAPEPSNSDKEDDN